MSIIFKNFHQMLILILLYAIIAPDSTFVHNGTFTTSVILCCTNTFGRLVASGQKYSNTTKLTCTKCDIYCVSVTLGSKELIGIFKYLKYIVLAITFVKSF